jgi:hypothetical protein
MSEKPFYYEDNAQRGAAAQAPQVSYPAQGQYPPAYGQPQQGYPAQPTMNNQQQNSSKIDCFIPGLATGCCLSCWGFCNFIDCLF